jgi:hypothetical protein
MAVAGTGQNNLALLSQMGAGDILSGTVMERSADGTLTIRTDRGVLALSGGLEAAIGSKVMLELRSTGARMQVVLLSVDGEPTANQPLSGPKIGLLTLLDAGKGTVTQAGDLAAASRPGAPAGPTLPAVPLPPLADQAGIVGARVVATLLRPNDLKPATQPSLPNAPPAQAGQRLPYHLAAILPPVTQAVTAAVEEAPRQAFIATVRQQTPEGELVLDSPLGTIRIPRPPEAAAPQASLPARSAEAAPLPPSPGKPSSPLPVPANTPSNAATAEATPEPAPRWPAGTRLVLTLPAPISPGSRDAIPAGPRLVATILRAVEPQIPTPAAPRAAAAPTPPSNAPAAPSAGTRVPLELVSVLPPVGTGASGIAATNPASGPQTAVLATLRTPSPNGQAILATPEGLVALDRPIEGPVGTRLLLLPTPQAPTLPEAHPGPAQIFNALLETAALLEGERPVLAAPAGLAPPASSAPTAAATATAQDTPPALLNPTQTNDILAQNLPRVGSHLAAGLASFIRARLSDKPVTWPSAELRQALQSAGRPELVAKLEQGFAELARAAPSTSQDGQWKTIVLPLLDEQALHQARLAIRRDPGKGDQPKDGKPASVHFLLDVELSRMGAMQLDGLVRGKRFDLMLRTHKPLDGVMQNEIQRLFAEAKSVTGITGEIYFQVAAVFASPDANAPVPSHAGGLIA